MSAHRARLQCVEVLGVELKSAELTDGVDLSSMGLAGNAEFGSA